MSVLIDATSTIAPWIRKEIELNQVLRLGSRGKAVYRVQEWLFLHDHRVVLDGDFGPVTDNTVRAFQGAGGLLVDGVVGKKTLGALIAPLRRVLNPIAPADMSFAQLVLSYARSHLAEHPLEIGGQNRGPWVRLYMNGHDGANWYWCAGFVTFVMKQAAQTLAVPMPIRGSVSCDTLAAQAQAAGRFVHEKSVRDGDVSINELAAGSIFLCRRTRTDWTHTGILTDAGIELFHTVEGNTNDEGHRDGYELCARRRGYRNKDFILL